MGDALIYCPFGVYMKDDVQREWTSALFTEPRHILCDRGKCALWNGVECSVKSAMLAIAGRGECAPKIKSLDSNPEKFDVCCGNCGSMLFGDDGCLPKFCDKCGTRVML